MRITIDVSVQNEYSYDPRGESLVDLRTEGDAAALPWEAICANLVQSAIAKYGIACAEADEGEE